MEMNPKHKSKLHLGISKMVSRQNAKPVLVYIEIVPTIMTFDADESEYVPLKRCFFNNRYSDSRLICLLSNFEQVLPGWFKSHRRINKDGKYVLTLRGKCYLQRKKKRKAELNKILSHE